MSNVVEPALNVNASSVNAGNGTNSVKVNVNAAVLNPKGDCVANNANATTLAGNLNSACSNVTPASKASYSSVVAAGGSDMEFAPVESSCEDLSSDESSGDSDMVCVSGTRKQVASEVSSDEVVSSDSDATVISPSQAPKSGKRAAIKVSATLGSHLLPGDTSGAALATILQGHLSAMRK